MWTRPFTLPQFRAILALVSVMLLWTSRAAAQLTDVAGSKDHPMIKRYEESVIIGYDYRNFGDMNVLVGPVKGGGPGKRNVVTPTKSERVESQTTRILYMAPEGRSPLEVLRNYQQELQEASFQTIYRCARTECGGDRNGWLGEYYLYPQGRRFTQTPAKGGGKNRMFEASASQTDNSAARNRCKIPSDSACAHRAQR